MNNYESWLEIYDDVENGYNGWDGRLKDQWEKINPKERGKLISEAISKIQFVDQTTFLAEIAYKELEDKKLSYELINEALINDNLRVVDDTTSQADPWQKNVSLAYACICLIDNEELGLEIFNKSYKIACKRIKEELSYQLENGQITSIDEKNEFLNEEAELICEEIYDLIEKEDSEIQQKLRLLTFEELLKIK